MSNIIWTNGCFDILHIGHIKLFEYAKSLGEKLIVGIDGDDRVRLLKGENRPINNEKDRKVLLESIKYIDNIYIFNNDDELRNLIKNNYVDTIVVGDDYRQKYVIGSEYADVIFYPKLIGYSTTQIYNDLKRTTTRAN